MIRNLEVISNGIVPTRYFPYRDTRFARFPSSFGTDPDNALMPKLLVF